jgi:hypothetical protein
MGSSGSRTQDEPEKWAVAVLIRSDKRSVWMQGVNVYLKANVLSIPFASNNICPLGCLD